MTNPVIAVIAMRWGRQLSYRRLLRKLQKFGAVMVRTTVVTEDSERGAVESELRAELGFKAALHARNWGKK